MPRNKALLLFFTGLITCFVVFHFVFFMAFMSLNKGTARNKALSLVNKNLSVVRLKKADLFINKNGIEWKDENKEMKILGYYFEVVSIKVTGDLAIAYLVADTRETGLAHSYFKLTRKHNKGLYETTGFLLSLEYLNNLPLNCQQQPASPIKTHFTYTMNTGFDFKQLNIKPPTKNLFS